jgi:hypothetical protein
MSWVAVAGAAISVGGSMVQANQAKKAAGAAGQASQVDIDALDAKARTIAQRNAMDSAALEQAMTPEVPQLRRDANNQVLQQMNPSGQDAYSQGILSNLAENGAVGGANTPLLRAAIAKAKADLAMGGRLSPEVQNAVTRKGLATAGTVGGGLGLGRDVVARDLGLTSMDVENRRLQNASQLGGQELALANADTNTAFNNRSSILNAIQLLQQIQGNQFGRAMGAAQYGQSIAPPVVGLDPGSVVDLTVGNSNAAGAAQANKANIYGAQSQNLMQFGGQLAGNALLRYNSGTPVYDKPTQTARPNNNTVGFTSYP